MTQKENLRKSPFPFETYEFLFVRFQQTSLKQESLHLLTKF